MSTTSDIYVHTNQDDLKQAAEALAQTLDAVLPTKCPPNGDFLPTKVGPLN
jgi:hypothetical protein